MKSSFHHAAARRTYRASRSARIRFATFGSVLILIGATLLGMAIADSRTAAKITVDTNLVYANLIPSLCGLGLIYIGYLRLRASWRLVLKLTPDEIILVDLRRTTTLSRLEIAGRVPSHANRDRGTVLVPRDRNLSRMVIREDYGFDLDIVCYKWLASIPELHGGALRDRLN